MGNTVTSVFIYYDNPGALRRQIECWATWPRDLIEKIVLIDDGSRRFPALPILRSIHMPHKVELYLIAPDIAWNMAGARNLGCSKAAGWIFISDMDTLLYAEDLAQLIDRARPGQYHKPRRVSLPNDRPMIPSIVSLLFHRDEFDKCGGYDEDFAGHYGFEEFNFEARLGKVAMPVDRADVKLRFMPGWQTPDARTTGLDRDPGRNRSLFFAKRAIGHPRPERPLRFLWSRLL